MNKALIESATNNPGKPADWKEEARCGRLPIRVVQRHDHIVCESAWKPTPEELDELMRGGYVVLHVWGWQVPVALTVVDSKGATEL